MNIEDRFHDAIDSLYEQSHHLATQVSYLGYPEMVEGFPSTAVVAWDDNRKKIKFMFNRKFSEMISDEEFTFIVAHEAMHIINGHLFVLKRAFDRLKDKKDRKELRTYKRKFAIASDCVVNDSLTRLYNLPKIELSKDVPGRVIYGKNEVGCHTETLSVEDVIHLVPDGPEPPENHDLWESFFNENGSLKESFVDALEEFIEKNEQNSSMTDADAEMLEDLKDSMADCTDAYAKKAGKGLKSKIGKIDNMSASLAWEKILFEKVPRGKFEDTWARPGRRFMSIWPEAILPDSKNKDIEEIFVAIDVSSSINKPMLNLFCAIVKNTPKRFRINAITFDTSCEPYNIFSETIRSGGGTDFHIIENYIQRNCKKYPKAVFVLTDGMGNRIKPQHPKRWTWLLYGSCVTTFIKDMTNYKLEKLLR